MSVDWHPKTIYRDDQGCLINFRNAAFNVSSRTACVICTYYERYNTFVFHVYPIEKYFTLLQKTSLYYRKLYYMKSIFSTKLETIKIHFSLRKLTIFSILILIDVLEYE